MHGMMRKRERHVKRLRERGKSEERREKWREGGKEREREAHKAHNIVINVSCSV